MKPSLNQDTQEMNFISGKKSKCYCVKRIRYISHSIHYHMPLKQGIFKVFKLKSVQNHTFSLYMQGLSIISLFTHNSLITQKNPPWWVVF